MPTHKQSAKSAHIYIQSTCTRVRCTSTISTQIVWLAYIGYALAVQCAAADRNSNMPFSKNRVKIQQFVFCCVFSYDYTSFSIHN